MIEIWGECTLPPCRCHNLLFALSHRLQVVSKLPVPPILPKKSTQQHNWQDKCTRSAVLLSPSSTTLCYPPCLKFRKSQECCWPNFELPFSLYRMLPLAVVRIFKLYWQVCPLLWIHHVFFWSYYRAAALFFPLCHSLSCLKSGHKNERSARCPLVS